MNKNSNKILVIRLSALGDVAMVIPVLYPICRSYPDKEFTLLTSPGAAQIFIDRPKNLSIKTADTKGEYKGIKGVFKAYFKLLRNEKYCAVADLHDVLRSKILDLLFKTEGTPVETINKGRKDKRRITSKDKPIFKQLKTSFERYAEVFEKLGLRTSQKFTPLKASSQLPEWLCRTADDNSKWIGIAPISKHRGKNYPLDKIKTVIDNLVLNGKYKIFLFGSPADGEILDKWQNDNIISLCNKKLGFETEMSLMTNLSVMVSMDSANMHIARIMGTPSISIWGATHPFTGFMGWESDQESVIERTDLSCRPCSVFGNKPCRIGDFPCLDISPDVVVKKILEITGER